ncbi:DNA polymerase delta catalytic subunit [Cedratvirus A11]|uniref:DNA-directed DNA polymerase n=1 Tax=Cedratvirus A11 TaxID=1903266 RepID=A0A1J0MRI0_9VIRU|nr:DNA polymerase delta catalytic subunit [Cedratvirus A11]APD28031.1 DNA polymerase b [Cedratvirus A11]SHO33584.1 DNA polymerase delta catalytic subunit [Cedratvirus A11]
MSSDKTLVVHAYDWGIKDIDGRINVMAWCLDEQSQSHLLRIPYNYVCYLELRPLMVGKRKMEWKQGIADYLIKTINKSLGEFAPIGTEFLFREKFYYYQGKKKYPMVKFVFNNPVSLQKLTAMTRRPIKFEVKRDGRCVKLEANSTLWEDKQTQFTPIRKLLTERGCGYAQWFEISTSPCRQPTSTIPEWTGDHKTMKPRPDIKTITSPKIFSFDIECYSNNHRAMPKEYIPEHVVYMISCVVFRNGRPEREKYLIVLGELEIEGVTVINVNSEEELCDALVDLIIKTNPDIITGYNIFGFDYPYLYSRLGLYNQEWRNISRTREGVNLLKEINWKSSAYSRQHYYMMDAQGRINFDLYTLARREMKLLRYNLETVAQENLGRGKHDISAVEMFSIYEKYTSNREKYKAEFQRVAEYCIEDALLVVDLIEKLNVWIWLVEFSSAMGVSVADLFIRGQQVRCFSLLQDLAIKRGIVMNKEVMADTGKYQGAYVSEPTPGLFEHVACLDFNSLYPNIMRAYNMCYTTLIRPEQQDHLESLGLTLDDVHIIEWDEEDEKTKEKKHFKNVFVKEHIKKGIFPELLGELIDKRNAVKRDMRGVDVESLFYKVCDKKQLGLKVVANSGYGFTGASQGFLPCKAIAASVTAMGRKHILEANDYISQKYGYKVVYNDTDSVFFVVKADSYEEAWKIAKAMEKDVSSVFPFHLNVELEKVGRAFYIKKKMYAFWGTSPQGVFCAPGKIMHKGTTLTRRDNCLWQRSLFEMTLMDCLNKTSLDDMFAHISEEVINLYRRKYTWSDFVVVKSVGEEYKVNTNAMAIFKEYMAERGCPINPGDRIDYIITDKKSTYLGEKMLSPEHFITDGAKVDYDYYLEHFGIKKIEKLYNIAHGEEIEKREYVHRERCAYMALRDFLNLYPEYLETAQAKEDYFSTYQALVEQLKTVSFRGIVKIRDCLSKLYNNRTRKALTSYVCKNPVKQQYKLIQTKKLCLYELLSKVQTVDA